MQLFALREVGTNKFLPSFGRRRGHTYAVPTDNAIPRLFRTKAHAKDAKQWWEDGPYRGDPEDGDIYKDKWYKGPKRHIDQLEIVEVEVNVR